MSVDEVRRLGEVTSEAIPGDIFICAVWRGVGPDGKSDWRHAWHGCKIEGLYTNMQAGSLRPSQDTERGERFFHQPLGVYVRSQKTAVKAENYGRFVSFCVDNAFCMVKPEVKADRARIVALCRKMPDP